MFLDVEQGFSYSYGQNEDLRDIKRQRFKQALQDCAVSTCLGSML